MSGIISIYVLPVFEMKRTLKTKFVLTTIFFVSVTVGTPTYFLIQQFKKNFHQRSVVLLETTLDMLGYGLNNAMLLGEEKNVQNIIENISRNKNVHHVRIFDEDGKILFSSILSENEKNFTTVTNSHRINGVLRNNQREIIIDETTNVYAVLEPIRNTPQCQSCHGSREVIAYLDVDTFMTQAEINFFTGYFHILFLGITVILLMTVGLFYMFEKYINKPIQLVVSAFDDIEKGKLNTTLPIVRNDEFGKMNFQFNRMVSELKSSREKIDELHFEQLKHADRLATIGELTAQMAHEINNYIGIIMSRIDYLAMESEKHESLKNYAGDFKVMLDNIEKVSLITKNILRHSKKRSKKFEKYNLVNVIDQSLIVLEPAIRKKEILLTKKYSYPIILQGDAVQIEQVFTNIINNAIDAVEDNGKIEITTGAENNSCVVKISDNGMGMNEETKSNIFSPFFSTKEGTKGTGLGLYIVKKICETLDVSIDCESNLNNGTTFILKFNTRIPNEKNSIG